MSSTSFICLGTPGDDLIRAHPDTISLNAKAGNDLIISSDTGNAQIYGQEGNDILLGGKGNDFLSGGEGNDSYDGGPGHDTILDLNSADADFRLSGDDNIAGGEGDDYIVGGGGTDRISGGLGSDYILPGLYTLRDFSQDSLDCGSGFDRVLSFHSSDYDTANINCELVEDFDS